MSSVNHRIAPGLEHIALQLIPMNETKVIIYLRLLRLRTRAWHRYRHGHSAIGLREYAVIRC